MPPPSSRSEDGERVRREVLGDEHVDRALGRATPFTQPFQEYITGAAWGDVWSRPGLDRRTRSAITLAHPHRAARRERAAHARARGAGATASPRRRSPRSCSTPPSTPACPPPTPPSRSRSARSTRRDELLRPVAAAGSGGHPGLRRRRARAHALRRRPPHGPDPRRRAPLPAHAGRPRLRAHRRPLLQPQPARARARLRVPVEPEPARGGRAAPRARSWPRCASPPRCPCSTARTSSTSPACRSRAS